VWGGGNNEFACRVRSSVRPFVRLHYRVRSINQIEEFSLKLAEMLNSTSGCTEPMLPMCQLKVKVTIEGQIKKNQI